MFFNLKDKRYYLDYAASTPVTTKIARAMDSFWNRQFANPSSIHSSGRRVAQAMNDCFSYIKHSIHSKKNATILFTSGGTESNQLALRSCCFAWLDDNQNGVQGIIVLSVLEHDSLFKEAERMKQFGFRVIIIPVNQKGEVKVNFLDQVLDNEDNIVFVSITAQSSEIGVNQRIKEISSLVKQYKKDGWPVFHTDYSQGLYYKTPHVQDLGVDMLTLCSQKFGGPKGVGVLYIKNDLSCTIEREGTLSTPLITGMVVAMKEIGETKNNTREIITLRNYFLNELDKNNTQYIVNGKPDSVSLIFNLSFPDCRLDSEQLIMALDHVGIEVSSKSACMGSQAGDSRVLTAMGKNPTNSIRISLHHRLLKQKDIKEITKRIANAVQGDV